MKLFKYREYQVFTVYTEYACLMISFSSHETRVTIKYNDDPDSDKDDLEWTCKWRRMKNAKRKRKRVLLAIESALVNEARQRGLVQ